MVVIAGILHTQWIQNHFPESPFISLSGNFFYYCSQQKITGVVVGELATRLEFQVIAGVLLDKIFDRKGIATDIIKKAGQAGITRNAGGVVEKLMDSDFLSNVLAIGRQII